MKTKRIKNDYEIVHPPLYADISFDFKIHGLFVCDRGHHVAGQASNLLETVVINDFQSA